jgi:peptidoglycan/xylan/chitin deacetylase (PgdA/CDA1 family)
MLPPAAPVATSAEVRLAYVLRHFRLAYPGCPDLAIGYAGTQPRVEIAAADGAFFTENKPYPASPTWREWRGRQLPFFFDSAPGQPLISYAENVAFISADIISAAFYLLSGWQEYFSPERDRHGRFPYAASVQHQYNFVTLPVVNYYFDVLKTAVEHLSGKTLTPRRWGSQQADFAAFISHDIDNLYSAWKAPAKAAWQQRQFGRFGQLLWQHLTQPDAWDNLEAVATATAKYGAKSTFFMLPSARKGPNGIPNADYRLTITLEKRLQQLRAAGCEQALHTPLGTATSYVALRHTCRQNLSLAMRGNRFHYLSWEPRQTVDALASVGFPYDATLGFAEHFGFRNSYCHPFYPFSFASNREIDVVEIPLNVMDATLHHPNYLQLNPAEILPALSPIFAEIKRFGGVASVLWHNENFDPNNTQNGPQQFHGIMHHLQQQDAAFLTGHAIREEFITPPTAPISNSYFKI